MQRWTKFLACGLAAAALTLGAAHAPAQAQTQTAAQTAAQTTTPGPAKLAAAPPVTYLNRFELYGGINLQNFQAGQVLPKRMNFGGVEAEATYWLTGRLGLDADFRGEAGTTPVLANPYTTRPLVVMYEGLVGATYRGPRNQRAALDYHALIGVAHGDFTETPLPTGENVGLYSNRTKPVGQFGVSLDFNRSKNLAFRLAPDLFIEHFGTETREFFYLSGGILYRFGHR